MYEAVPIGRVESPLTNRATAPKQADEDAPEAWLIFEERVAPGLSDIRPGAELLLLTWLDRADREVLQVHPRDDKNRPLTGVFSTRSPDRPNPLGLHRITVLAVAGRRIHVSGLDALNGTPIIDLKPVLDPHTDR
ncbi:tRNA (N6-threonylcarbamoyladenosine(37)-N6)-methyltransferase TrmO [Actinoplanes sp. NPDC049599]|uniref:tRNA (N6-threonylcarbamoyladenosine(37)-N6)-methyltransferase TrmO n=1 Tax=Actinoplanes sp. NPDC049599 TaxID=3363903 RepID=UPI0037BD044A